MKKIIRYCIPVFLSVSLFGCIDTFQYITRMDDGKDRHTLKAGLSRTVLQGIAAQFNDSGIDLADIGDIGDSDIDSIFSTDHEELENEYKQFNGTLKTINNETEIGYTLDMEIFYGKETVDTIIKERPGFIPLYTKDGMSLEIPDLADGAENNEYGALFLSMGRYRLLVSKHCLASVSRVTMTKNQQETALSFLDLGDSYFVEIPMPLLMEGGTILKLYAK